MLPSTWVWLAIATVQWSITAFITLKTHNQVYRVSAHAAVETLQYTAHNVQKRASRLVIFKHWQIVARAQDSSSTEVVVHRSSDKGCKGEPIACIVNAI